MKINNKLMGKKQVKLEDICLIFRSKNDYEKWLKKQKGDLGK